MKEESMAHYCVYQTQPRLQGLCGITGTPPWAHVLVDTYFANWPAESTQAIYKDMGLKCSQYWYHELKLIFASSLTLTPEFRRLPHLIYYIKKYAREGMDKIAIADMDWTDREHILHAFSTQLGMHWSIFPYTAQDFVSI